MARSPVQSRGCLPLSLWPRRVIISCLDSTFNLKLEVGRDIAMTGTPLPKDPARVRHASAAVLGAYPQVYRLERKEQAIYDADDKKDEEKTEYQKKRVMYARILGYLMLNGPGDKAAHAVGLEVNACSGDEEKLLAIGEMYFNYFIRACKPHFFLSLFRHSEKLFNSQNV